ncbi:DUF1828 domain-containing protein [Schleiferilactobacillus perolens]|uniref:DUF1828 domain-containing protein n=1 Tax=Schleiferilactobacillus perolens DSM 12744 TaxID=1423792 RepID=A0A0R1N310_9LACO|nr:DUF1828 domain-containing protein [Schleiferilactobacillus perolens]KRL14529.1 hypothetical protein FD09_GL000177 [Schleiferilactobacillus perolens DSM 12744]
MIDANALRDSHLKWLQDNTIFKQIDDGIVRIETSFVDAGGDGIIIYAIVDEVPPVQIILSDDSWTLETLAERGVSFEGYLKRQKLLINKLHSSGVQLTDSELTIQGNLEQFSELVNRFLQTIIFINDMSMMANFDE